MLIGLYLIKQNGQKKMVMIVSFLFKHLKKRNAVKRVVKLLDDNLGYKVLVYMRLVIK